jgi:hypothetical protein
LEEVIRRRLANCFEAYEHFPFEQRFEQFKTKKKYFLEGKNDEEVVVIYHEFIFYHFVLWNHLVPKIPKSELLEYFYKRINE